MFQAFKEIEVTVRKMGGYPDTLLGVGLMREAFHAERGKLTDMSVVVPEREATQALFAGASAMRKTGAHCGGQSMAESRVVRLLQIGDGDICESRTPNCGNRSAFSGSQLPVKDRVGPSDRAKYYCD